MKEVANDNDNDNDDGYLTLKIGPFPASFLLIFGLFQMNITICATI